MPRIDSQISVNEQLRSELEALVGVQRAVVDGETGAIVLVCEAHSQDLVEPLLEVILEREGIPREAAELYYTHAAKPGAQRRVRFQRVEVQRPLPNFSVAEVVLEWQGDRFGGRAEGEGGGALELRVCAQATIEALHQLMGGEVSFQLVGVKPVRIFDNDLIAVLLHCPQAADRRLVGLSLVVDDPDRSASLAVLNATNRLLGNYLATDD
jgi:hypothetical protein